MYNTYKSDMKQNQKLMWKLNTAYNFKNSWIKLILDKKYCFDIIAHKFISHKTYQFWLDNWIKIYYQINRTLLTGIDHKGLDAYFQWGPLKISYKLLNLIQ